MKKKIIVVLGMHRSGTSAITRGLKVLGADFGSELMPAQENDNEKGFWEDLDVFQINEKILNKLGIRWDAWSEIKFTASQLSLLIEEKKAALELLNKRTGQHPIYAFKDPRTCILLPFWQWVFGSLDDTQVYYLLAIRHPQSVATSLERRNHFAVIKSYTLWLKHNYSVLTSLEGTLYTVIDYDTLMAEPKKQLLRLASAFAIPEDDISPVELKDYTENFLSEDLRHNKYDSIEAFDSADLLPFMGKLYSQLYAKSNDENKPKVLEELLPSIENFFTGQAPLFQYIDQLEIELVAYRIIEEEHVSQIGGYERLNEKQKAQFRAIYSKYAFQIEENDRLKGKHKAQLQDIYSRQYVFDRTILGRWLAICEKGYALLKLRPNYRSYQRQLIDEARAYLEGNNIDTSEYGRRDGRLILILKVFSYAIRNPYSSLRLVSIYRIKKLIKTIFSKDQALATNWVEERFPEQPNTQHLSLIAENESLDSLQLDFPKVTHPFVSIVVPVFNEYRTTISCLQSILNNSGDIPYEVIIGDDESEDLTCEIESKIKNIKVIRAEQNQGFLKNCNNAVSHANSDYIVLLNNDTNVQPGWLEPLLSVIQNDDSVGLVGPKLLFENGKLQEAGGIIWKDGSGWNYGRGQNAEKSEFNYLRETDYISGACVMFRKSVWDQLGGFDEYFCPAYYEDTDIAFQMRKKGLKVIYQPESAVVHFEGVSNGTDLSSGIKKHQVTNQKKFVEKWRSVLEKEHFQNAENVFQARDRSRSKRTVVIIDHYVPLYDKDAGSRSTWLYAKAMVDAGLNVKFIPANFHPIQPYTRALQHLGVEVLLGENYARNWKKWFKDNAQYIDVIYMHRPHITEGFIDHVTKLSPQPKLIYFGHDLHYLRTQREAELLNDNSLVEQAKDWKKREFGIFEKVDKVFYPSFIEVEEVKHQAPHIDVSVLPLYLLEQPELSRYQHADRKDLLFVGGFAHPPNEDAVIWFIEEILPLIHVDLPDVKFHVVGSKVPDSIKNLQSQNVIIHGFLTDEDLAPLYEQIRVSVVPLRFGAGVKGKVLEALQAALPIVTTSIGAEGLPDADKIMMIGDSPESLAELVIRFYQDENLCNSYLSKYPSYIDKYFSNTAVRAIIDQNFLN